MQIHIDFFLKIYYIFFDFEKKGTRTLAYTAARVEAILIDDRYAHTRATWTDEYAVKLTTSQKSEISKVYDNALDQIDKENSVIALEAVEKTTRLATEAALKAENESQSQSSQSSTISSDSFSEAELASYMSKLEEYLVETAEYQKKAMAGFISDSSCKIESKHTVKYNKEAATKVRKAVADFLIDTFEITSPL